MSNHTKQNTIELDNVENGVDVDEESKEKSQSKIIKSDLIYSVEDVPPWYMCILLGFQQYLTMFGATVSIPFILCPLLCISENDPARGYIISTMFFVSGIITLLQVTFGIRLPIVQGGTFSFLVPTIAILSLPANKCPAEFTNKIINETTNVIIKDSNTWPSNYTEDEITEEWQRRMREVQGAIIVASILQVIIGYFGIIGLLLHYITPLTIAPAVSMVGLSLFEVAITAYAAQHWGISIGTIIFMILFSQYLTDVPIKIPTYKDKRWTWIRVYVFKLFPVLMTIMIMWIICAIGTYTGEFGELKDRNPARTDLNLQVLQRASWIRVPYPFQWGWPTVTIAGVLGMLAGVVASAIESIGDYFACARLSGAPPPPTHAINRGIGTEGVGCIIAGIIGSGNGTTSYSENIGAIGVTKVGSRRVIQWGALVMIVFGILSKLGSVFVLIPQPIIGGLFVVMFSMITAVGLSSLQFVDLNSTRNLFVLGFSIFFGLAVSKWTEKNFDSDGLVNKIIDPDDLSTEGVWAREQAQILAQLIRVILSTGMFISGILGFVLDNTVPGTPEERGLTKWRSQFENSENSSSDCKQNCYDLPFVMEFLRKQSWAKYIPFLPTYQGSNIRCCPTNKLNFMKKSRKQVAPAESKSS